MLGFNGLLWLAGVTDHLKGLEPFCLMYFLHVLHAYDLVLLLFILVLLFFVLIYFILNS